MALVRRLHRVLSQRGLVLADWKRLPIHDLRGTASSNLRRYRDQPLVPPQFWVVCEGFLRLRDRLHDRFVFSAALSDGLRLSCLHESGDGQRLEAFMLRQFFRVGLRDQTKRVLPIKLDMPFLRLFRRGEEPCFEELFFHAPFGRYGHWPKALRRTHRPRVFETFRPHLQKESFLPLWKFLEFRRLM